MERNGGKSFLRPRSAAGQGSEGGETIHTGSFPRRRLYGYFAVLPLLLIIISCHYREAADVSPPEGPVAFERIAVMPFQSILPEDEREGAVRCPLCGAIVGAAASPGNPERTVEALFLQHLEKNQKINVISGDRVAGIYRRISTDPVKAPLPQVLRQVGQELGAEAVLAGYVFRFRERKGVSYAAEQPASVAFGLHLLRVADGAIVWKGHVDRTQSALMEDLLQLDAFIRQRGRWATAEELAADGMERIFKTFPFPP
jgi:hypothetical protein